jgi:predicted DNA-binding transcriptional regulator
MRLKIDKDGYAANERLVANDVGNALLASFLQLQQHFDLRAEAFQVFLVILLATVQKVLRDPGMDPATKDATPLLPDQRGGISRRQIAEVLGIPFETVRRHVAELLRRGMIEERARGQLSTRGGTLARLSQAGITLDIAQRFLTVVNAMERRDVIG